MRKDYTILRPRPGLTFDAIQGLDVHVILKDARLRKDIGIRELSRLVGCSHVFLLKVERGEKFPSPRLLDALQRELGLDPFFVVPTEDLGLRPELLSEAGEHVPSPPRVEILVALMLTALRQGGFKPVPKEPTRKEKKDGIVASIALDPSGTCVISIKTTN
jgi:transcriptional regulator with XRE-family HTH domain